MPPALAFAKAGANVAVVGRTEASTQETVQLIEQACGRAIAIRCDVAKEDEIQAAVAKTISTFGRLDFALNNAGVEHEASPWPTFPQRSGSARSASTWAACSSA